MTTAAGFVHLHCHTYYSLLDGANPIGALVAQAKAHGMAACAMTDHGNLFGAIEFYQAMTAAGIQPILGCEAYLLPKGSYKDRDPRTGENALCHLTLLARNVAGYRNLCRLSSYAYLDGFYYKPRIDKELLAAHSEGLLCLTGCLNSEISRHLRDGNVAAAQVATEWYLRTFGEEQVFFEIMRHDLAAQPQVNGGLIELARRFSRPLVATNDCHYLHREQAPAHDALLCIQTAKVISDTKRLKMDSDQFYFRSPDEMRALFADIPDAVANTVAVAKACAVELDFKTYHFPKFQVPGDRDLREVLREQTAAGLAARWAEIVQRTCEDTAEIRARYEARLETELACITAMGFAGYFLIVADFIQFAKQEGIPVGPGRGSAAGSLVSYCLRITDIDPLYFGCFFERFLNPERVSMPDMDIDFCMRGRERVIQYVQQRYGNVGQIITFGKMKAKAVVRDVARVMGLPYGEADRIAKLIPNTLGITLAEALEAEPQLRTLAKKDERIAQLLATAQSLEGFPRHASTHAAGVVISDRPLTDFLPLYRGTNGEVVTQFDMKAVEKIGLIKFDFLGLKTLTILHDALGLLRQQEKPVPDLNTLPLADPAIYAMLGRGDTQGIFQLESSGMTDLVVRLQPSVFEDLVALVALFRPGPLGSGMVDDFINRKHGRTAIEYPLPQLEPILRETYGVILYQEQVMQIASVLANYSLGEADLLRRAMGKKKAEEMAQQQARFLEGCAANQIAPAKAAMIFDLMEKFAGYGFNKSHSVAYAMISYQTAYLKAHAPTEFFAAVLSNEMGATDKVLQYLQDAKTHGITVLPPDLNACEEQFTIVGEATIRFGLAAVKNVGSAAIEAIVEARTQGGPFQHIFDCAERIDTRRVNRRVWESLIKCGALDTLGVDRATVLASLDLALDYGAARQRDRASNQENLFGGLVNAPDATPAYITAPPWEERERLAHEKALLGFYLTGHPLEQFTGILEQLGSTRTDTLMSVGDRQPVRIGGVVSARREILTKRGEKMGFITLEDLHGTVEVVVFSDRYLPALALLQSDTPLFVIGTTDANEETVKIICDEIFPLDEAPARLTRGIHLRMDAAETAGRHLEQLRAVLQRFAGECPVYLHLVIPAQSETVLTLPRVRVAPTMELQRAVAEVFGRDITRFEV